MNVTRSIAYGVVDPCKTESSQEPVPIHSLLTLTAAFESPTPQSIRVLMRRWGFWHPLAPVRLVRKCRKSLKSPTFFYFKAKRQPATVFQLARRQQPNRLKTKNLW